VSCAKLCATAMMKPSPSRSRWIDAATCLSMLSAQAPTGNSCGWRSSGHSAGGRRRGALADDAPQRVARGNVEQCSADRRQRTARGLVIGARRRRRMEREPGTDSVAWLPRPSTPKPWLC
jgi:hypothetical protein